MSGVGWAQHLHTVSEGGSKVHGLPVIKAEGQETLTVQTYLSWAAPPYVIREWRCDM